MTAEVDALAAAAHRAATAGAMAEAERLWNEVRRRAPNHPQALFSLAAHALQRGDARGAEGLLATARAAAPDEPMLALTHAVALRELGDADGEWTAINDALVRDAYFLPAHLEKGSYLLRRGQNRAAATVFKNALVIAGDERRWPDAFRERLVQARAIANDHAEALSAHLAAAIGPAREHLTRAEQERWREATSVMAGLSRPYHSDSNQLFIPRLPAIPFFERDMFGWVRDLEAQTGAIRAELDDALAQSKDDFTPYITYRPGDPVNQWRDLNHSTRWATYQLWRSGAPVAEHLKQCPATAAALERVEMAEIGGLCPNAMFSALAPHTEIPPHHGETNARLVVHLPLIVPEKCTYRVGFERRQWTVGEVLIFDDTLEHTARNDSDELRVVLIFDVWNPLLSVGERALVNAITDAARAFHAEL